MKIKEVLCALEKFAPLPLQESWDNAGLQIGLTETEVSGALLCLDVNERIIDEAVRTVDEVAALTGIDFFPALDDATENRIEASAQLDDW